MKAGIQTLALILFMAAAASAQNEVTPRDGNLRQPLKVEKSTTRLKSKADASDPRVLRLGPSTTYLRKGISVDEVLRLLGKPASVSERLDGRARLATYIFPRSEGRVLVAEFENGILVHSDTKSSEAFARERG